MIPADHSHAPWRKAILIPFWVVQLALELLMIALLALAVGVLVRWDDNDSFNDSYYYPSGDREDLDDAVDRASKVVGPIWIALISVCLILTVTEIVLLARKKLKPLAFLITNALKSAIFLALFIIDIVSTVNSEEHTASAIALVIEAALLLAFWLPLVYASIIYHRYRKGTSYNPVNNPVHTRTIPLEAQTSEYPQQYSTEFPDQYKAYVAQDQQADSEASPAMGRRLSYNHQIDPRFEAYRQRSNSGDITTMGTTPMGSPRIPEVLVEHHDGHAYEMENARRDLR